MSSVRRQFGAAPYGPTSLDFINHPNPIEPHADAQKHPLHERLEPASNTNFFRLAFDSNSHDLGASTHSEPPTKRQKVNENPSLDLPKLPVRHTAKRLTLPPTLSGLYEPPPDARLLPPINLELPQVPLARPQDLSRGQGSALSRPPDPLEKPPPSEAEGESSSIKAKRRKWTDEETECLLKGVQRFGIGNWTKILSSKDFQFNQRSAIDLKDRFRVCCPEQYKADKVSKSSLSEVTGIAGLDDAIVEVSGTARTRAKGPVPERVSVVKLRKLGIDQPFAKTSRRSRHGYTKEEDEAILRGFEKYGTSWASIQQDESLCLSSRKPTDLRDRLRTRFPEKYAVARPNARKSDKSLDAPKRKARRPYSSAELAVETSVSRSAEVAAPAAATAQVSTGKDDGTLALQSGPRRPAGLFAFALDDDFFPPFNPDDDYGNERIVLDRGILDWAISDAASTRSNGIDPLMTLKLPEPMSSGQSLGPGGHHVPRIGNTTSLPSLRR